jgi:hypothetical protein
VACLRDRIDYRAAAAGDESDSNRLVADRPMMSRMID